MKVHEYQAKSILARYGVPVPRGEVTDNPAEAREIAKRLGGRAVVKAQIHAGGRGKGGGVKLAKDPDEAVELAKKILGMTLVTAQTGPGGARRPEGPRSRRRSRSTGSSTSAITLDRGRGLPAMMASKSGGMEIEEVAAKDPKAIVREVLDPGLGMFPFQARKLAFALGLSGESFKKGTAFMPALFRAYVETDASLAEINPLLVTKAGDVLALDAKMTFDDNALFRHPDIQEMRDLAEEDPLEVEASKFGLNYIKLDGSVGCMVNGAGLAMATMDLVKLAGGEPAELPGRRRRRQRGAGQERVPHHPVGQERARDPHQHLRRHHALRHHRQRGRRGRARDGARDSRSSCAWRGPTSTSARRSCASRI